MRKEILIIPIVFLSLFLVSAGTIQRTIPAQVNPSSQFTISYTASEVTGQWGAIIVDDISGGCTFPEGTKLKAMMLSEDGKKLDVQVNSPASGSCSVSGYYQFNGGGSKTNFNTGIINIQTSTTPCTKSCTGKSCGDDGCGGTCGTCVTGSQCTNNKCISSSGNETSGGFCEKMTFIKSLAIFDITKDKCTDGMIIIIGAIIILLFIFSILKK